MEDRSTRRLRLGRVRRARVPRRQGPPPRAEVVPVWSDEAFARLFGEEGYDRGPAARRDDPRAAAPPGAGDSGDEPEDDPDTASGPGTVGPGKAVSSPPNLGVVEEYGHDPAEARGSPEGGAPAAPEAASEPPFQPEQDPDRWPVGKPSHRASRMRMKSDEFEGAGRRWRGSRRGSGPEHEAPRLEPWLGASAGGPAPDRLEESLPPYTDTGEARIASKFAPDLSRFSAGAIRRRDGWYYGVLVGFAALAAVIVGPDFVRLVSSTTQAVVAALQGVGAESPSAPYFGAPADGMPGASGMIESLPLSTSIEGPGGVTGVGEETQTGEMVLPPTARFVPPAPPAREVVTAPTRPRSTITATGPLVVALQSALAQRGYAVGPIDGLAGARTHAAIRDFRRDRGLGGSSEIDDALLQALGIQGERLTPFRSPSSG